MFSALSSSPCDGYALQVQAVSWTIKVHGILPADPPSVRTRLVIDCETRPGCRNYPLYRGCGIVDGTPLLDIKSHVSLFDTATDVRTGWFSDRAENVFEARSDRRFSKMRQAFEQMRLFRLWAGRMTKEGQDTLQTWFERYIDRFRDRDGFCTPCSS